jgi:hypothetical protein
MGGRAEEGTALPADMVATAAGFKRWLAHTAAGMLVYDPDPIPRCPPPMPSLRLPASVSRPVRGRR